MSTEIIAAFMLGSVIERVIRYTLTRLDIIARYMTTRKVEPSQDQPRQLDR